MFEIFQQLPNTYQGMFYIVAGMVMLLYALGIIEKGITLIIVMFAIFLICIGCIKIGLYQRIVNLFRAKDQIKDQKKE
ncbi:MAG TPA: hypothetical protein VKR54_04640 [Candidatus Babeliales bacterium]|jgi:hypothetical protein|nr:hypothetical protein [Candidatus Babeliales bacterium]